MFNAIKRTFNSRPLMLWILIFPGVISLVSGETPLQYASSVLLNFTVFVFIEALIIKFNKNKAEEK